MHATVAFLCLCLWVGGLLSSILPCVVGEQACQHLQSLYRLMPCPALYNTIHVTPVAMPLSRLK